MIQQLLLIGAGGFAREVAEAVRAANAVNPTWDLLGYLDDSPELTGSEVDGVTILGTTAAASSYREAKFVICTGNPRNYFSRARIAARLGLSPDRFATVIHPNASVATTAAVGPGTVLLATAVVTARALIGAHVAVMPGVVLTHDNLIGDFATFASGVRLGGSVTIGTGAYLGAGSMVREGLSIGSWAQLGIGALALQNIPPAEIWVGSPARRLRSADVPGDLLTASQSGSDPSSPNAD